jgi:hypothetical protein
MGRTYSTYRRDESLIKCRISGSHNGGSIFWDMTTCSPLKSNRSFGGTCRLHPQDWNVSHAINQLLIAVCFMLVLCLAYTSVLKMEMMLFRNVRWLSTDYTLLHPKIQSWHKTFVGRRGRNTTRTAACRWEVTAYITVWSILSLHDVIRRSDGPVVPRQVFKALRARPKML